MTHSLLASVRRKLCSPVVSLLLLAFALAGINGPALAADTAPLDPVAAGRALAQRLCAQKPIENLETSGVLKTRYGTLKQQNVTVRFQVIPSDTSWQCVYEAINTNEVPAEKLVVTHRLDQPDLYRYARAKTVGAPLGELAELLPGQATNAFADSDFAIGDLGLEFLHWPDQRWVKQETRMSRPCHVLESRNPQAAPGGYTRVLSWIDAEKEGVLRAEAYAVGDNWIKEFAVRSLKKVNGVWQLEGMEIRNARTHTRCRLEFEFELREEHAPAR